jgi:tRNA-dihydrouridine synthase A
MPCMSVLLDVNPWRACVAPMMDWTDRHCRYLHRLLSQHARLYTEMVTTGALLHGDVPRHLDFDAAEHPVALQLGGNDPAELALAARLGEQWGYDEINLNCGCPSDRVQRGAFGACLMAEPAKVADGIRAMQDAVSVPVTVKHRIGIDRTEHYGFVRDFVGTLYDAGCRVFIVHARNAWLDGLSPKQNREVPPLRWGVVRQLKADFARATMVINGGISTTAQVQALLQAAPDGPALDGVMVGREAYHNPYWLAEWDRSFFDSCLGSIDGQHGMFPPETVRSRQQIEAAYVAYLQRLGAAGLPWHSGARHMLGLYIGQPGARRWRQVWSDHRLKHLDAIEVMALAHARHTKLHDENALADNAKQSVGG